MGEELQLRRGNKDDLPLLLEGEPGYNLDTKELNIGNKDGAATTFINKAQIDSIVTSLNNQIGDRKLLKTGAKTSLVNAINEVYDLRGSSESQNTNVFLTKKTLNSYVAPFDTSEIPLQNIGPEDYVDIILNNLLLLENVDYRFYSQRTKLTLLNYRLKANEAIYYITYETKPNVFLKLVSKNFFLASKTTNEFVIPDIKNYHFCHLYYQGLLLEEDLPQKQMQYYITENGVVTLHFTLEPEQYIYYEIYKKSYDYNDLINLPSGNDDGSYVTIDTFTESLLNKADKNHSHDLVKVSLDRPISDIGLWCKIVK